MTATINPDQTVTVGDNLFALDGLVEGYKQILDQAKDQLENLELTESQLRQIQNRTAENFNYRAVAYEIVDQIRNDSGAADSMATHLESKIYNRLVRRDLRELIRNELHEIVQDKFDGLRSIITARFNTLLEEERRKETRVAIAQQEAMKTMLETIYGPALRDLIKAEARDAAREAQPQQEDA